MKTRIRTLLNLDAKLGRVNIADFDACYLSNLEHVADEQMKSAVRHRIDGIISYRGLRAVKTKTQVVVEFAMARHTRSGAINEMKVVIPVADF